MRINSILILTGLLVLGLSACSESENKSEVQKEEGFTLTGELSGIPDGTMFYMTNLSTAEVLDSVRVEDNGFRVSGQLTDPPEQIWLNAKVEDQYIFAPILMGNEDVKVKGDLSDFPWNVQITGSKTQDECNELMGLVKDYEIKRDSLIKTLMLLPPDGQKEKEAEIWAEIRKLDLIKEKVKIDYIKSHPHAHVSAIELGYLKNGLPKDTVQKIFDQFTAEIKHSKYAKIVEVFLRVKIPEVGDQYHDFEGTDQRGNKVKLSDILGPYTLLEFTAANCGPCVFAAAELIGIQEAYADSLKIVSFTQDKSKDIWLSAVERDSVTWTSVWDGKGRYSETSIKYGADGVPMFIIIDSNGVVVDKWFGYEAGYIEQRINNFLSPK